MPLSTTTPYPWPEASLLGKFAGSIPGTKPADATVTIFGVPDDTGVMLNKGRTGAAEGPSAFRAALCRYGSASPDGIVWPRVADAGDVVPGKSLAETHDRVTAVARAIHDAGSIPVMIGGGHDLTFPFVRALCETLDRPPTGIYFDAHLDVRAEEGSGMPFRRLVEQCAVRELHVHGLDPFANSAEHVQWFQAHGGHIDPFGPDEPWPDGDLFVSFDLDVIDQSSAPGVSAMNPQGWTPLEAVSWAYAAGMNRSVRCFDIMELSPPHDEGGRTARLAAKIFLSFLAGVATR